MPLTDEEKRRIEEEEKYRAKIRAEEVTKQPHSKSGGFGCHQRCLVIVLAFAVILALGSLLPKDETSRATKPQQAISPRVSVAN